MLLSLLSHAWVFATLWTAACETYLSFTVSQSLLRLMSIVSTMASNHLILSPPPPPALILSRVKVFSNEPALHIRWPKYWNFSSSNSPFNEYSGLISFGIDCFDLLAVQGTLKNLLQHNSIALILWYSAFFMVQISPPYMTTGKTIALTERNFVGKVMSVLLFCCLGWS